MIIAGSGHRPPKLGGFRPQILDSLRALCRAALKHYEPTCVISGMALGFDTALALAADDLGIPFTAAIPCDNQDRTWPPSSQKLYQELLAKATTSIVVTPGPYNPYKMLTRDEWMVDNSDALLSLFNGHPQGGTWHTVKYAQDKGKLVIPLWDRWKPIQERIQNSLYDNRRA